MYYLSDEIPLVTQEELECLYGESEDDEDFWMDDGKDLCDYMK